LSAVAFFARLKAIAFNLFPATADGNALGFPGEAIAAAKSGIRHTIFAFKEQFLKPMGLLAGISTPARNESLYELKIAT
jgi:hypothetical protein